MFQNMQKFVSTFRELEKKEHVLSTEQEQSWRQLKEKLSSVEEQEISENRTGIQTIVVAGLYPRTGASFIASNYALYLSGKNVSTTLCEIPGVPSYLYVALDFEKRTRGGLGQQEGTLLLQGRKLKIKAANPMHANKVTQQDIMNWFFTQFKSSNVLIIDVSSSTRTESTAWLMGMADQIWVVVDPDFPRLSHTVFIEEAPSWWKSNANKIRIILNKWSPDYSSKGSIIRKIEGTLSVWDEQIKTPGVNGVIPALDGKKVIKTQLDARLFLELFPDDKELLDELAYLDKGRFL